MAKTIKLDILTSTATNAPDVLINFFQKIGLTSSQLTTIKDNITGSIDGLAEQLALEETAAAEQAEKLEKLKAFAEELGVSVETLMPQTESKGKRADSGKVIDAVECEYDSEKFTVKVSGNIAKKAKKAIEKSGLERSAFIEKYKV